MRIQKIIFALLAAFLLAGFSQHAEAQSLSEADTVRFTLPENSQFLPGRAGLPSELKNLLAEVRVQEREFDQMLVIGTYDEKKWAPAACNVEGDIPLQENWQTRQDQCDAEVARWRAIVSAQYMLDQGWLDPYKIETKALLDERERGIVLIFIKDNTASRLADLERRLEDVDRGDRDKIEARVNQMEDWFDDLRERVTANESAIAENRSDIDSLEYEVGQIKTETRGASGAHVSPHLAVGGEVFAGQFAPVFTAGMQIDQVDLAGWWGYMPSAGEIELSTASGNTRRITYGGSFSWYGLSGNSWEIGPTIGFEHGEDILEDREEFVVGYEAWLFGAAGNFNLSGPLSLSAYLAYANVDSFAASDLELKESEEAPIRAAVSLRVNF